MDFTELNKIARKAFSTKEMAKSCVSTFAKSAIENEKKNSTGNEWSDEWIEYYSIRVKDYSANAVDIIFKHAESKIEILFLGTLLLSYLRSNPMGLIFRGPLKNANKELQEFRDAISNSLTYWNQFKRESSGDESIDNFHRWLTSIEKRVGRVMKYKEEIIENVLSDSMQMFNTYHIAVQATFPDIKIEDKHIRADILVWIPKIDDFKIIVECDGFETHKEKDKFITDRKRDRILKAKGFDVLRYSGSEIYNDPVKTGYEFFEFLSKKMEQLEC